MITKQKPVVKVVVELWIRNYILCWKDLRKNFAKKHKLPPYVIFQDVSLEQMATMYPINMQELQNVQGVGAGKAKRFGKEFCELIRKYCEDNEIERPEELRVRTVAKKSMLKVSIIRSIDRRLIWMTWQRQKAWSSRNFLTR